MTVASKSMDVSSNTNSHVGVISLTQKGCHLPILSALPWHPPETPSFKETSPSAPLGQAPCYLAPSHLCRFVFSLFGLVWLGETISPTSSSLQAEVWFGGFPFNPQVLHQQICKTDGWSRWESRDPRSSCRATEGRCWERCTALPRRARWGGGDRQLPPPGLTEGNLPQRPPPPNTPPQKKKTEEHTHTQT